MLFQGDQIKREQRSVIYPPAHPYEHPDYPPGSQVWIDPAVLVEFPGCACAGQTVEATQGFFWEGGGFCSYQPHLVPVKYCRRIYSIPQQYVRPLSPDGGEYAH